MQILVSTFYNRNEGLSNMYNRTILIGRLTADPELKQTTTGVAVTSFTLAVNRSYTPKGGEKQADFIDIVAWRQTAEFICRYFSKGKAILVEGSMQTRSYTDKNGNKRKAVEVVADSVNFIASKQGGGESATQGTPEASRNASNAGADIATDDFAEIDSSEDLPF